MNGEDDDEDGGWDDDGEDEDDEEERNKKDVWLNSLGLKFDYTAQGQGVIERISKMAIAVELEQLKFNA